MDLRRGERGLFREDKMIFYTNWFIPSRFKATTYGPFIFIRPSAKDDAGLLAHEQVHVKQFWRNPLFGLAYFFSKKARFKYEAEAYRAQLLHYPERLDALATILATKYKLNITKEDALRALTA
jgi:hypothetical protein